MQTRHFLKITDLSRKEILEVLELALKLKGDLKKGIMPTLLPNKTLAMIFEKPSLRTRVSFEVAMTQLGGQAIYLGPSDIQMGVRESPADVARNLERMVELVMARVFKHRTVEDLAQDTKVPVINGLSDLEHPCQALADLLTVFEHKRSFKNLKLAFVGDGENNVTHSLALAAASLGMEFVCASPVGYRIKAEVRNQITQISKNSKLMFRETADPCEAVVGADVVLTDTWISMGDEAEKEYRLEVFRGYQIDSSLMAQAKKDAIFMHCLPAYRGYEVSGEVIDGPQSVVFDEAENRLHAQKALILFLLGVKL